MPNRFFGVFSLNDLESCGFPLCENLVPAETAKNLEKNSKRDSKPNSTKSRKKLQIELTFLTTFEIKKQHHIFFGRR